MKQDDNDDGAGLGGLHWLTAALFMAAGAEAALGERRGDHRPSDAVRWAPLLAAPAAGAAHAAHAIWPGDTTRLFTQIANGVAIGIGAAGLAGSVYAALSDDIDDEQVGHSWVERVPSLAPLAFAAIGVFGYMLQDHEEEYQEELDRLERRGRIVERLVPKRRTRVDRIVVHV
jgi:hypothetical protein